MNIGEEQREIIIEPIEEPRWIETPVEAPAQPIKEPVPA